MYFLLALVVLLLVFTKVQSNRRRKTMATLAEAIQPGARVMTTSGIYGIVVEIESDTIVVEISEGVDVRFAKAAVMKVVPDLVDEDLDADGDAGHGEDGEDGEDAEADAGDEPASSLDGHTASSLDGHTASSLDGHTASSLDGHTASSLDGHTASSLDDDELHAELEALAKRSTDKRSSRGDDPGHEPGAGPVSTP